MIVTVDGPGGTGKSTVSRVLAHKAGLPHLDTGAFYRAATLAVLNSGVDPSHAAETTRVVDEARFDQVDGRMYLDGEDVSDEIRSEEVTAHVSVVSSHRAVREVMVDLQRDWVARHDGNGVVEGRDIGTVVFPDADVKIFLDARPEVRARRRANETGEGHDEVLADLSRRDHFDSTREASPMSVPPDAVLFDTSDFDFDEVVERLYALIAAKS
jgi:cytidylate kinase